ncbi:uncharacterized protein K460DRAFT_323047 [Cucurbitaria berberidis CBS 394.84]|uniref:Uncharacterized protein n=1 Tax=Cucurbitaria berberidis CBS 394.84 TaxID=1168544 RepID=A0A9P4G7H1_9PLEO|nr:uncharacterized protein K460DRAFT_323047 [Cucurbitaria berberidis CBS 394.84]KAF1840419.1 hypothetical protein K460DRAFT_323047 [Cucurbitaria berberidis CBS 394.84]
MIIEARYNEMKEKMQVIKDLYLSRHYTQCAMFSERLLSEVHDEIHPLHLAYLNFYTALSHDTLAREATLKNRYTELSLAEKHYSAAISVLSPYNIQKLQDEQLASPLSTTSNEDRIWKRRSSNADSVDSSISSTSSNTEIRDLDPDLTPKRLAQSRYARRTQEVRPNLTTISNLLKPRNAMIAPLSLRPQTTHEYQLAADTSVFVRMMEGHLASVQELKEKTDVPVVHLTFPSPRLSRTISTPRTSHLFNDKDAEVVRQSRRAIKFRPRFDPTSVQRSCSEALAELS